MRASRPDAGSDRQERPRAHRLLDAPGGTYCQHWRTYVTPSLRTGMIGAQDMNLFGSPTTLETAVNEILHF
jgi:hypothetical protein